jgi:hypothetical protein
VVVTVVPWCDHSFRVVVTPESAQPVAPAPGAVANRALDDTVTAVCTPKASSVLAIGDSARSGNLHVSRTSASELSFQRVDATKKVWCTTRLGRVRTLHGDPNHGHHSRRDHNGRPHECPRRPHQPHWAVPHECTLRTRNLVALSVCVAGAAVMSTRPRWGGTPQGLCTPERTMNEALELRGCTTQARAQKCDSHVRFMHDSVRARRTWWPPEPTTRLAHTPWRPPSRPPLPA